MFFMPECIGFNNIHMHAGIIHHSLMSCQQSVIWPIMHEAGIMDGRHWNRVHRLPCLFSLPCHARLWFSFLQLGDSSHSTFLTVTVSSVSYGQFWGARVKWELTSEIVVIFCCVYYYLLYHSGFIHINFLPLGLWFPIWSGIFLFCCLNDLGLFPDNNNISIINSIILPLKRYSRQIGSIVCTKRNAPLYILIHTQRICVFQDQQTWIRRSQKRQQQRTWPHLHDTLHSHESRNYMYNTQCKYCLPGAHCRYNWN